MKPVHSQLITPMLFLSVTWLLLSGCGAGQPARSNIYSIGVGCTTSQDQTQGFNLYFLIEGVSPEEYKSKTDPLQAKQSNWPQIRSPLETPKVVYDFDPENIVALKKEFNELLEEESKGGDRSQLVSRKMKINSEIFMLSTQMSRDYQNRVREIEFEERKQQIGESSQLRQEINSAYLKVAEEFVRSGKKCMILLFSWSLKEGEHPSRDIGPEHGIVSQENDISFSYPKQDHIFFDLPAGKMRLGTQAMVGLPGNDGKCHVLTPQMEFKAVDVNTSEMLSAFLTYVNKLSAQAKYQEMRFWEKDSYWDKVFFTIPATTEKESWIQPLSGQIESNRFDLYTPKFSWKM